ncbi:MAG TPA: patatin-like phospholipase family protein [Gemmatimonadales bacterium]|nr:patatin-like phospholipase family protein [Gemmatimonadales bacterium]
MSDRAVALVLSGGGAKTAAHLGAVRAVLESDRTIARYVATSMGAVMAAGLAGGAEPSALLDRLAEVGARGVVREPLALVSGLFARSLLRPAPLRRAIELLVPARRFADLAVPLTVAVADLDSGALVLYGDGGDDAPLIDVLCATCALPLYYPPVVLSGRRCGDGGVHGVLPLAAAARVVKETVVAVDVGPGHDLPAGPDTAVPPMVRAHDEALGTMMAALTAVSLEVWRRDPGRPALVYVRPLVERGATFQVDRMRRYAEDGHRAAREALAQFPPRP